VNDEDGNVGDGATLDRPLVRRRGAVRIGHATIGTQPGWCATAGVKEAIFTHCGSGIVRSDPRTTAVALEAIARDHGVRARLAYDGFRLTLVTTGSSSSSH